ncbi:molybdopterin synthase sulfur carrier subunit [Methanolinea mesophila]|uniref:ubiquitin-like small modifier protein 1 n=1 Tax=Methanolinea mesophila TaxID=547055 RepID=UPI001AEAB4DD|nr:ubiquitin-like small modifier protein 1 [Methanolinea mesophila]MBP1927563.1 molybdopterin synthase sulfur carrier subunit [Methanolinea mesophila]
MKIRVKTFARFRELMGTKLEIELPDGSTVRDGVACLVSGDPTAREALFDEQGHIKNHVIVMVNRRRLPNREREAEGLHEGDELAIFPPVAGG